MSDGLKCRKLLERNIVDWFRKSKN